MDPLLFEIMADPVILPKSRMTIDRSTIQSHLLSDPHDPFNRSPLQIEDVIPNSELKDKIAAFRAEKKAAKREMKMTTPKIAPTMLATFEPFLVPPTGTSEGSELAGEVSDAWEVVGLLAGGLVGPGVPEVEDWSSLKHDVSSTVTTNWSEADTNTLSALPKRV